MTGSSDKTAKIWELRTGEMLHKLEGHFKCIEIVVFSSDS